MFNQVWVLRHQLTEWRCFSFDVVYFYSQLVDLLVVVLILNPQFVDLLVVMLDQECVGEAVVVDVLEEILLAHL